MPERQRRFERPHNPESLQLTERDLSIIRYVFRHRFLSSQHIESLVGGSRDKLLRRLKLLYNNHYLDRPREQLVFYTGGGTRPMVYGLGNKGADLLTTHYHIPRKKVDWTSKNREAKPVFLEHTLMTADFMVALECACKQSTSVRFIRREWIVENMAPEATRKQRNPYGWSVDVLHNGDASRLGLIPDHFFGLHFTDKPEGRNKAYFFFEADRSTMPIVRKNLRQTSYLRKMLAYHATLRQNIHTQQFGIKNFRVLTVTTDSRRVDTMIAANKVLDGKGLRSLYFTDRKALAVADPLSVLWRNGQDDVPAALVG